MLNRTAVRAGASVTVSVRVTNMGDRAGAEVAQLYVSHPTAEAPIRALQGFQRVTLAPGESRELRFTLDARALSLVDGRGRRLVSPGRVGLWIGGGQPASASGRQAQGAATAFRIMGSKTLPE